jgi:hypothetical protein
MKNVDIDWTDVEKKVEEDELKNEKKEQYDKQQKQQDEQQDEQQNEQQDEQQDDYQPIGIAALFSGAWNEIVVPKGYEPVSDAQEKFLEKHTARFEEKYLKNVNLIPELETALAHSIVYLPKWLAHSRIMQKSTKRD